MPLLVLIGDMDDWAPTAHCRALQQAGFRRPGFAEIIYYPGAHHGFDINAPSRSVSGAGFSSQDGSLGDTVQHHIEYDPIAARDAEARTRALLETLLQ
jgi:dienelactone hydrolase